jgi:hypothetical protein
MTTLVAVFSAILAVFVGYVLLAPTLLNLDRFLGRFAVQCPVHHSQAAVRVNSFGAALTSAYGNPKLQVRGCTLLARGEECEGECLHGLAG